MVPRIRAIAFWGLYWGPIKRTNILGSILGSHHFLEMGGEVVLWEAQDAGRV